jgi:hypothetical protein
MTQADSVLSTPPTNTSVTRRNMIGTIAAAAATAVAAKPVAAAGIGPIAPDPIFAAIGVFRQAHALFFAEHVGDIPDEIGDQYNAACSVMQRTRPTTPAGLAVLTTWAREQADWLDANASYFDGEELCALTATIDDAARGMSGLEPWLPRLPAAVAHKSQTLDAELIELGARFEPLVDQYYVAQRRWSERSGGREASDALSAIHREMKQLMNAINAASVTSIEGLRAKALVAFWEVAPLCAGDTEFSFEDAYPFQQLFTAVAELCGLKDKLVATGYELPDIAMVDDDSDDEGEEA